MKVDQALKVVKLPEVFKWYETDFSTISEPGVMYINQFRKNASVPTWYAVDYHPSNWGLNDQK